MMPGIRSFGRIGASPVLESVSALRNARPTVVDLRRQQQPQQQQQQQQSSQNLQTQALTAHRAEASMGPKQQFVTKSAHDSVVEHAYQADESSAHSRYSGSSSGSEHEPSSDYLAGLVSDFMEVEQTRDSWRSRGSSLSLDDEEDDSPSGVTELSAAVQSLSSCSSPLESRLFSDVLCALQLARSTAALQDAVNGSTPANGSNAMRRAVMARLRSAGYNAAVCKSRWDHSRGFPGGDYEYIDVVFSSDTPASGFGSSRERLIVDLDFRAQFQVARPTPQFEAALLATPVVFVGRSERLQQLVELLSDACRRSLKIQGMHLPPWRKAEYLRAKWFAPYKRTTNSVLSMSGPQDVESSSPTKPAVQKTGVAGVHAPLSFAMWPEGHHQGLAVVKRPCQPVQRQTTAPKGVLGMLLQEQVMKTSPVS